MVASGNVTFNVPAGAVSSDVRLTATVITDPVGSDKTVAGAVYEFGPAGTQFATPVTVALKYAPASLPEGLSASDLTISRFENGQWVPLSTPVTVDPDANEVRVQLSSFSRYAVTEKSCAARVIEVGATRGGSLTTDDCVFNAADGRRFDVYRFSIASRQVVKWTTTGTVTGGHGIFTPGTRTAWAAVNRGVSQSVLLDAGTYEVYVRGNDASSVGAYTATLESEGSTFPMPARASCASILMNPGTINGRYEPGDCEITLAFANPPSLNGSVTYADYYVVRVTPGKQYTVTLTGASAESNNSLAIFTAFDQPPLLSASAFQTRVLQFTPQEEGFRYIEVAASTNTAQGWNIAPGNYTLTITEQ